MKDIFSKFLFKGGIHPPDNKALAKDSPLEHLPLPRILTISTAQHLGAPAKPIVAKNDHVVRGQLIAAQSGSISANVHAPASGIVADIVSAPTPTGRLATAIILQTESTERTCEGTLPPIHDWQNADPSYLLERIREAGVIGMGGAGFPTAIKLSPPADKPIDTLIINGAECEPYLNGDNRMQIEHAEEIVTGAQIIRKILNAKHLRFAIEENKPEAIRAISAALKEVEGDVQLVRLRVLYPQGSEKQQIYSVTGRRVPMGGLPMDVACVVENVETTYAVFDAVVNGAPLTERAITVSGDAVARSANFIAPVGTHFSTLLEAVGGLKTDLAKIVSGGPMMGFALPAADIGMTKTSSGILFFSKQHLSLFSSSPCINCGRCVQACPLRLMPTEMSKAVEADDIALAEELHVMDCFECGSCTYACPAHRPLVQHFRRAKAIIAARRRAKR